MKKGDKDDKIEELELNFVCQECDEKKKQSKTNKNEQISGRRMYFSDVKMKSSQVMRVAREE
jgi:hypothetical protein